jgi:hypothetical protein
MKILAKFPVVQPGHSERSEESRIASRLRSFISFRMTRKFLWQEPQRLGSFRPEDFSGLPPIPAEAKN